AVLDRCLRIEHADADGALQKDLVALDELAILLDVLLPAIEESLKLREQAGREVVQQAAGPVVVVVEAAAADLLEHVEDLLAVAEAPQDRRRRAKVEEVCAEPHQVRRRSAQLTDDRA